MEVAKEIFLGGGGSAVVGQKSKYLEAKILNAVFQNTALPTWATIYFALFTTAPTVLTDTGVEPSTNNYGRVAITNNATNWPNATLSGDGARYEKTNGTAIVFPTSTGVGWGTQVGFGVYDAATVGNLLYYGLLTTAVAIGGNTAYTFGANTVLITES